MLKKLKRLLSGNKCHESDDIGIPEHVAKAAEEFYAEQAAIAIKPKELPEPVTYGNLDSNKTILLVDDQEPVFYLYKMDFEEIKTRFDYDVLEEFKIVKCSGQEAGAVASGYINNTPNEIVIGILDLTLGNVIKLPSGETVLYDGVDLAIELIKLHPRCKIGVCTAHMLENSNPAISRLIEKFSLITGHNLLDYAFSKNSDRAAAIYKLIEDVNNGVYTDYSVVCEDERDY